MPRARIVLVAVLLLAAACSDGRLTKEEYIAQADKICAQADKKTEGMDAPRTPEALAEFVDQAQRITGRLLKDLRELKPPEADQEVIDKMLGAIERAMDYLPQIEEAANSRNLEEIGRIGSELAEAAKEANETAQEYGLEKCGRSGTAPVP